MPDLGIVFFPIVWAMERLLEAYVALSGSVGLSILLLSATFSLLLFPLQLAVQKLERPISLRMKAVNEEVRAARASGLRGEALFNATEKIYQRHRYHPIQAMFGGIGFLVAVPILISSIFLFHSTAIVDGQSFLFIRDLAQPDAIFKVGPLVVNILPPIMFVITFADARMRFSGDKPAQRRFLVISSVLLVLVYAMPSGLVLYWIGNNLSAMALASLARMARKTEVLG